MNAKWLFLAEQHFVPAVLDGFRKRVGNEASFDFQPLLTAYQDNEGFVFWCNKTDDWIPFKTKKGNYLSKEDLNYINFRGAKKTIFWDIQGLIDLFLFMSKMVDDDFPCRGTPEYFEFLEILVDFCVGDFFNGQKLPFLFPFDEGITIVSIKSRCGSPYHEMTMIRDDVSNNPNIRGPLDFLRLFKGVR